MNESPAAPHHREPPVVIVLFITILLLCLSTITATAILLSTGATPAALGTLAFGLIFGLILWVVRSLLRWVWDIRCTLAQHAATVAAAAHDDPAPTPDPEALRLREQRRRALEALDATIYRPAD